MIQVVHDQLLDTVCENHGTRIGAIGCLEGHVVQPEVLDIAGIDAPNR